MYQSYEVREKLGKKSFLVRLALALTFLLSFGFAGGVLFLLLFMVPVEQWLIDQGSPQNKIDMVLSALTLGWILFGLLVTALYGWFFLVRRRLLPAIGVSCASVAAAAFVFFFLLDTDLMIAAGRLGEDTSQNERLTFGPYPDAGKLEQLEEQGYDGVITLLSPTIPFEEVLLKQELKNAEEVGIPIYSEPMLPWVSKNRESLEAIKRLTSQQDKQFYIHCYLGKHRVDLVRRELDLETGALAGGEEPLPKTLERGRLTAYDDERIVLGPYPTDEEWLDVVLRRNVREIVSTLDPANPEDMPWIEKERKIAESNDMIFTLKPLNAGSPDPAKVREIARYVSRLEHKVYVHDFLDARRFLALESELQKQTSGRREALASDG